MSRPSKYKKICKTPSYSSFGPLHKDTTETVTLSLVEYEVIRLMDVEGLNQTQCGQHMEISRATVQRLYDNARKIIGEALICGKTLEIKGGHYELCHGNHPEGFKEACCKHENNTEA